MLPAWLATHRAARRLTVNDDAAAAAGAAVLGPLALPVSPRRDHASLELGVLGLAHQGAQLRIALAQRDDQRLIAIDEGSRRVQTQMPGNRHRVTPLRFGPI